MRSALLAATAAVITSAVAAQPPAAALAGESFTDVIVTLDYHLVDAPDGVAHAQLSRYGGALHGVYRHALKGFSASLPPAAIEALRANPLVYSVEPDGQMSITGAPMPWGSWPEFDHPAMQAQSVPTGIRRVFADRNPNLKINGQADYVPDVDVAVFDTGIDFTHPDLNVVSRVDCTSGTCRENAGTDGHGHGSHVAGTVAAIDNGIGVVGAAPGARLHAIKVLGDNGNGDWSWYLAAVDYVTARAGTIDVTNASLGGTGAPSALEDAINRSVDAGIVHTVAAGNNRADAQNHQPAAYDSVITVSALADFNGEPGGGASSTCRTDQDDTLADFSNRGAGIEVTAPGVCIHSTFKNGTFNDTFSGTSMASPHVAAATALYASTRKPTTRSAVLDIRDYVISTGNLDWTDDSGDGVREPLLDVGDPAEWPPGPPDPGAPNAAVTTNCSRQNTTCRFDGSASSDPDGRIASYAWDFGDSTTGTGATVSHTYGKPGTYLVQLTVTDNDGKKDTATQLIRIGPNQPPTAVFTASCHAAVTLHYCLFDGKGSSDQDGTIASYAWDFGDGTTGSGDLVFHDYGRSGSFTVTLTVTDDQGAASSTAKPVAVP